MGSGLRTNNPTIVSAFNTALAHQFFFILIVLAVLVLVWNALHVRRMRGVTSEIAIVGRAHEADARRVLRVSFGLLWILDGALQAQSSMPLGMPSLVIKPTAAASPEWVRHLVNAGATVWTYHPIAAPASAVWIQIGLGLMLIVAPSGHWSRLGGLASALWGIAVWVFGESFGGLFAPGMSWLFGAPGAVLFYCLAGVLVALPDRQWDSPYLGRAVLRGMGAFFVVMAVVQSWPGRGFWQGHVGRHADAGSLAAMTSQMSQTPQPRLFSTWINAFTSFDSAHGWAVNLFVVVALGTIGVALLTGGTRIVRVAVIAAGIVSLATWVLVQDFGFLGGLGTDPNSMIPIILILASGYIALTRIPAPAPTLIPIVAPRSRVVAWRELVAASPSYAAKTLAAVGAVSVALVGAVPMAIASANPNADPIVTQAIDGTPGVIDSPAPSFRLVDAQGRVVTLGDLRGKALALTFLDPVCNTDCPIIAQELKMADRMLGVNAQKVNLVSIVANPLYRDPAYLRAFDRAESLQSLSNWQFLTGSLSSLNHVWNSYGIQVVNSPAGAMIGHTELVFVIDPRGQMRYVLNSDAGPGSQASKSSFAVVLADYLDKVLVRP
jgi:cytochrome oxidase Cu insertion factor (SCO1/SenC/PrrC family)